MRCLGVAVAGLRNDNACLQCSFLKGYSKDHFLFLSSVLTCLRFWGFFGLDNSSGAGVVAPAAPFEFFAALR